MPIASGRKPVLRRLFVWLSLMLIINPSGLAQACEKTVRWFDDPPYDMRGEDGEVHGASADLVREVLGRMGCQAQFIKLPWARGLRNLQNGSLDLLPGALVTPEREAFAYFSAPTHRSPNVLFIKRKAADGFSASSLADLRSSSFRLAVQIGVVYSQEYAQLIEQPDFQQRTVPIHDRRAGWQMIKAGRLDGMIADEVTGLLELQEQNLAAEIVRSPLVVSAAPAAVAFSRKSLDQAFVARFNAALAAVIADGTYVRISQRYLPCAVSAVTLGCVQALP